MAEITEYNYMFLRDTENDKITHIEIQYNGTQILRLPVTDARVTHNYDRTQPTLTYILEIHGTDPDVTVPLIANGMALYDSDISTDALSIETFATIYFASGEDSVRFTYTLDVPHS